MRFPKAPKTGDESTRFLENLLGCVETIGIAVLAEEPPNR